MSKILTKEPNRAGPICGYQIATGMPWDRFCGEPKAPGLYACRPHHDEWALDEGNFIPRLAPGNAVGTPDPAMDPEYPYNPIQERSVLLWADAREQAYGRRYAEDLAAREDFDPSTTFYYSWYVHGTSAARRIPECSGEGAIYTPEHLAKREGIDLRLDPHYWYEGV